ncbi:MAG: hypothetical protein EZS28_009438 [Streblomastix strix]|uniref:Uncharacterized protein n=1 Tax=Streblomastix strix TaxID=222440 RepID=A0A5J4WK51_9EUKA|nr:MAG: hypothetical protein EZS28_009438 [Streblomastix strix]
MIRQMIEKAEMDKDKERVKEIEKENSVVGLNNNGKKNNKLNKKQVDIVLLHNIEMNKEQIDKDQQGQEGRLNGGRQKIETGNQQYLERRAIRHIQKINNADQKLQQLVQQSTTSSSSLKLSSSTSLNKNQSHFLDSLSTAPIFSLPFFFFFPLEPSKAKIGLQSSRIPLALIHRKSLIFEQTKVRHDFGIWAEKMSLKMLRNKENQEKFKQWKRQRKNKYKERIERMQKIMDRNDQIEREKENERIKKKEKAKKKKKKRKRIGISDSSLSLLTSSSASSGQSISLAFSISSLYPPLSLMPPYPNQTQSSSLNQLRLAQPIIPVLHKCQNSQAVQIAQQLTLQEHWNLFFFEISMMNGGIEMQGGSNWWKDEDETYDQGLDYNGINRSRKEREIDDQDIFQQRNGQQNDLDDDFWEDDDIRNSDSELEELFKPQKSMKTITNIIQIRTQIIHASHPDR